MIGENEGEQVERPQPSLRTLAAAYERDGFISPVAIISQTEALEHRRRLEAAEAKIGPLHYKTKVHTILRSAYELATHPNVLDVVEALLGPNILLHNVTYIVKEPGSKSHVSWHQDLTYWGFNSDDQVSLWLALSPATEESGCMRMIAGSHTQGMVRHETTQDETNVLLQGQTVRDVHEENSILCPLSPGEASFHHGWTLHASMPNRSADRRIGLNVQYFATHVRQVKAVRDSAILVRGRDDYGYYEPDIPAAADLEPSALARQEALERRYRETAGTS
ncbi:MAG: phytanoyl-CoA dioxygenase family protein [Hyphomicrobiaceae bacterium]